jgi:hypothetical protein
MYFYIIRSWGSIIQLFNYFINSILLHGIEPKHQLVFLLPTLPPKLTNTSSWWPLSVPWGDHHASICRGLHPPRSYEQSISSIAIIVDGQAATNREGLIVDVTMSGPYNSTAYRHHLPKSPHEKLLVVVYFFSEFLLDHWSRLRHPPPVDITYLFSNIGIDYSSLYLVSTTRLWVGFITTTIRSGRPRHRRRVHGVVWSVRVWWLQFERHRRVFHMHHQSDQAIMCATTSRSCTTPSSFELLLWCPHRATTPPAVTTNKRCPPGVTSSIVALVAAPSPP